MKTGIKVNAKFYWIQFILLLTVPRVVINGEVKQINWGESYLAIEPGDYLIEVYFKYFFITYMRKQVQITLEYGSMVTLKYHTPLLPFTSASFKVIEVKKVS